MKVSRDWALPIGLLLIATPASAQSVFDGVWKGDVASAKLPDKPDVFAVRRGVYSCSTCIPAISVPADGRFHAVSGHPYWDEIRVTVVDPATLRYDYRSKGNDVATATDTLSGDGRTLTTRSHSTAAANAAGMALDGGSVATRVASAAAGAHPVSGSWRTTKFDAPSNDAAITMTISQTGQTFNFKGGTGESFAAVLGGPAVVVAGDRGGTMTSVRRVDDRTVLETDTRDGKVVATYRMTVLPDGRTMRVVYVDPRAGTTTEFTATRQ